MAKTHEVICHYRPSKKEKAKVLLSITTEFNKITDLDIQKKLSEEHGSFYRHAAGRYQWDLRNV